MHHLQNFLLPMRDVVNSSIHVQKVGQPSFLQREIKVSSINYKHGCIQDNIWNKDKKIG